MLYKPLFLVFAFANLIIGLISGLGRMGWQMPLPESYVHHGAIMVGGFLGTLIALEKIIPLKRTWFYAGPLLSACSVAFFLSGNFEVALAAQLIAGLLFVLIYVLYLRLQYSIYLVIALAGALCWVTGTSMLLWKQFYPMAFPWWMGFLLLTIVSERLELSKFLPVSIRSRNMLLVFLGVFLCGLLIPFHSSGTYLAGVSLLAISGWLLRHDVIKLTIKKQGLARFTAVCLLGGYVALLLVGILLIVMLDTSSAYDILLHTFFIGFVFAMIFAHGPVILPAVLGLSVKPYHPVFYFPLVTLFLSLGVRITADAAIIPYYYRAWSGWLSAGSMLLYFVLMVTVTLHSLRHEKAG